MIVLTQGMQTGTADLAILVRDASGSLVDQLHRLQAARSRADEADSGVRVRHAPIAANGRRSASAAGGLRAGQPAPERADAGVRGDVLRPVFDTHDVKGRLQDRLAAP